MNDKTRVCQIPPIPNKRENWLQRSLTIIMSLSIHTKAAFLQLAVATQYFLIGGISVYSINIVERIFFGSQGRQWEFGGGDAALSTFFIVTILPLVMSAIAFVLFYRLCMNSKNSWHMAIFLNFFGILAIMPTVLIKYSYSSSLVLFYTYVDSYDNIKGVLLDLVLLTMILSFASFLYLSARDPSRKSASRHD